jgi:hypothetical protein
LLPSAMPKKVLCACRLVRCEFELRIAQAHRTLRDIWGTLLMQAHLHVQKDQYGHSTKHMTRSNQLLADVATRLWKRCSRTRRGALGHPGDSPRVEEGDGRMAECLEGARA